MPLPDRPECDGRIFRSPWGSAGGGKITQDRFGGRVTREFDLPVREDLGAV